MKKAISPVVATALLLIVAVVAVVGFQSLMLNTSLEYDSKVTTMDNKIFKCKKMYVSTGDDYYECERDITIYTSNIKYVETIK